MVQRMNHGIKERRLAVGISQQKLAELAECSIATVRLVENGWQASEEMLARITAVLEDEEKAAA